MCDHPSYTDMRMVFDEIGVDEGKHINWGPGHIKITVACGRHQVHCSSDSTFYGYMNGYGGSSTINEQRMISDGCYWKCNRSIRHESGAKKFLRDQHRDKRGKTDAVGRG